VVHRDQHRVVRAEFRVSLVDRCDLFFFQAEEGIRDRSVTGVQTCALPIWWVPAGTGHAVRSDTTRRSRRCRPAVAGTAPGPPEGSRSPGPGWSPATTPGNGSGPADASGTTRNATGWHRTHQA